MALGLSNSFAVCGQSKMASRLNTGRRLHLRVIVCDKHDMLDLGPSALRLDLGSRALVPDQRWALPSMDNLMTPGFTHGRRSPIELTCSHVSSMSILPVI